MLADLLDGGRRALRGRWVALVVTAVLAYFGYHALHGQRGLLAWMDTKRELEVARRELAQRAQDRGRLERRVDALKEDRIDRDLLEEELRKLGYVRPDEVIVLKPAATPGTS